MDDLYKDSKLFFGLTPDQCEKIIDSGFIQKFDHKSILFHQGDPARALYMVINGRLKVSKLNEEGEEAIIHYVNEGELAAAISCLQGKNYPVFAESVGKTEIIGWDRDTITRLMNEHAAISMNLLNIVLERFGDLQQRFLELSNERVEQRIARALLRLMQSCGLKKPEGILIDFPLSRQDIAAFTGTTLFTVSRTLSIWTKNGWIKSGRERITIIDPHALMVFAENA